MTAVKTFFAVTFPAALGLTLAQINGILGAISLAVAIAHKLWQWRREAKQNASPRRRRQ